MNIVKNTFNELLKSELTSEFNESISNINDPTIKITVENIARAHGYLGRIYERIGPSDDPVLVLTMGVVTQLLAESMLTLAPGVEKFKIRLEQVKTANESLCGSLDKALEQLNNDKV